MHDKYLGILWHTIKDGREYRLFPTMAYFLLDV